jgi:hypothetical protein
MSQASIKAELADSFYAKLSDFVAFIRKFNPEDTYATQFNTLMVQVYRMPGFGSIAIIENVGWYFQEFSEKIANEDIKFFLDYDFTEYLANLDTKPALRRYAEMARNLVPMMKNTYLKLEKVQDQNLFKLFIKGLLKLYLQYITA